MATRPELSTVTDPAVNGNWTSTPVPASVSKELPAAIVVTLPAASTLRRPRSSAASRPPAVPPVRPKPPLRKRAAAGGPSEKPSPSARDPVKVVTARVVRSICRISTLLSRTKALLPRTYTADGNGISAAAPMPSAPGFVGAPLPASVSTALAALPLRTMRRMRLLARSETIRSPLAAAAMPNGLWNCAIAGAPSAKPAVPLPA